MTKMHLLGRVFHFLQSLYWKTVRPITFGVKAIILNEKGDILLVRHSYVQQSQWMLPGGGLRKGETAEAAIEREVWEELRLRIVRKEVFGQFVSKREGKTDNITLFICHTQGDPRPGDLEILEAKFYARDSTPANASPATRRRLSEFLEGCSVQQEW